MPPRPRAPVTPPSDDGGQIGVLVFRLDDVVRRLDEVSRRMEEQQQRFETTYLSRREFELAQVTDSLHMRGIEAEAHKLGKRLDAADAAQSANRRLAVSGIILPVLATILAALILAAVLP